MIYKNQKYYLQSKCKIMNESISKLKIYLIFYEKISDFEKINLKCRPNIYNYHKIIKEINLNLPKIRYKINPYLKAIIF